MLICKLAESQSSQKLQVMGDLLKHNCWSKTEKKRNKGSAGLQNN